MTGEEDKKIGRSRFSLGIPQLSLKQGEAQFRLGNCPPGENTANAMFEFVLGSGLIKLDPEPDGCQFYHRQEVA